MAVESLSYHSKVSEHEGWLPVIARFDNSLHLARLDGDVVTVTTAGCDGPLTVRVDRKAWTALRDSRWVRVRSGTSPSRDSSDALLARKCELGKHVTYGVGRKRCRAPAIAPEPSSFVTIGLSEGREWRARPAAITWDAACVRSTAAVVTCRAAESAFFHHDMLGRTLAARRLETIGAMREGPDQFRAAVRTLAGLGPGLTPSGSDWMVGLATALWHLSHAQPFASRAALFLAVLETGEASSSTRLSQTLVKHAAAGTSSEDLISLAELFSPRDAGRRDFDAFGPPALTRVLAWGHTSGADVALGLADGAGVVLGLACSA